MYTTQTNNGLVADQTKYYDRGRAASSPNLPGGQGEYLNYLSALAQSVTGAQILQSTHGTVDNGSAVASFNAGNSLTYASYETGFRTEGGVIGAAGDCLINGIFCAGNPLGVSSWFYKVKPFVIDESVELDPPVFDEFDNLTADGYWGLIKDPNSAKYILSYTLAGANPKVLVSTDLGRQRQASLDYQAQVGSARLIGFEPVIASAVPEPQQWLLMGLGLGMLGTSVRRRQPTTGRGV
jgi:PEP-CTERM motif